MFHQNPPHKAPAVKRTLDGVPKALGGDSSTSFESYTSVQNAVLGSQQQPIDLENLIDENDFDSDVDLETEMPKARKVAYPTLPEQRSEAVKYPSLNQKAQYHSQAAEVRPDPPPPSTVSRSSEPFLWSSSPDYHRQPPDVLTRLQYQAPTAPPKEDDETPRPTKRRTLPWLGQEKADAAETQNAKASDPSRTPAQKKANPFPWNTTASAVKEQRSQFRKVNKKAGKEVDVDESKRPASGPKKPNGDGRIRLSQEQKRVLELVVEENQSVFFTGSAGTGKSVLLREIIAVLRKKYTRESDRVAITASTGLAACNIGGVTLHSFAGIGLGKEDVETLVKKVKRNQKAKHRWMRTKVLIIDEVSMVDGELFDKLERVASQIRNNGRPFGGIQLVITGDFFQLPPVPDGRGAIATFAFDAQTWGTAIKHTIGLHQVFRQKDPVFAGMLNEMREGHLTPASIETFRSLSRQCEFDDNLSLATTELFPTRAEVEAANSVRMRQLGGNEVRYLAVDTGAIQDETVRNKILDNCIAPKELIVKKGSQVMLIKNMDDSLVNGSLGKVVGFMSNEQFSTYNAHTEATEGNGDEDTLEAKQLKAKMELLQATTTQFWPVVRFAIADGTTRDLLCDRETWKTELPNGEVQAQRAQVPLILAWALSIHKAQGQTLERVKVDLGKVFEKGQAYVALSRATSIQGLQVLRFDPSKVQAHPKVRTFYSNLSRAESIAAA